MTEGVFLKGSEETDALGQDGSLTSFSSTGQYSPILTCFHVPNEEFRGNLNYSFLCIKAPIKSSAPAVRKAE